MMDANDMPEFEYYDIENHLLINYYPYMTLCCQGGAFVVGVLYSFTNYRVWNFLGTVMAGLCLPVDVLIFYKEPLGVIGTLLAMVFGFVPFGIMISDAAFPEEETLVSIGGMKKCKYQIHLPMSTGCAEKDHKTKEMPIAQNMGCIVNTKIIKISKISQS